MRVHSRQRGRVHVIPFSTQGAATPEGMPRAEGETPTFTDTHSTYCGGPVISNLQVVPVFRREYVNASLTAPANGAAQFLSAVSNSRFVGERGITGRLG